MCTCLVYGDCIRAFCTCIVYVHCVMKGLRFSISGSFTAFIVSFALNASHTADDGSWYCTFPSLHVIFWAVKNVCVFCHFCGPFILY